MRVIEVDESVGEWFAFEFAFACAFAFAFVFAFVFAFAFAFRVADSTSLGEGCKRCP
jgi:hypothetical protein